MRNWPPVRKMLYHPRKRCPAELCHSRRKSVDPDPLGCLDGNVKGNGYVWTACRTETVFMKLVGGNATKFQQRKVW